MSGDGLGDLVRRRGQHERESRSPLRTNWARPESQSCGSSSGTGRAPLRVLGRVRTTGQHAQPGSGGGDPSGGQAGPTLGMFAGAGVWQGSSHSF